MKPTFTHKLSYSFMQYFDHTLLDEGQAYANITSGNLYSITTKKQPNSGTFYSPYGQWVYDTSIAGANVATGFYKNGQFYKNNNSGCFIDYRGGGVLTSFDKNSTNIVANYSIKEFNIYTTNDSDTDIVFNNKDKILNKYPVQPTGLDGRNQIAPAIFLKLVNATNEPYQFGGTDQANYNYRAIIWASSQRSLEGVADIFIAKKHRCFMLLEPNSLNSSGNISMNTDLWDQNSDLFGNSEYIWGEPPKETYNYIDDVRGQYKDENLVYIKNVEYMSFKASTEVAVDREAHIGILDFEIEIPR